MPVATKRWKVIALTNNYAKSEETILGHGDGASGPPLDKYPDFSVEKERAFLGWTEGATPPAMRALFDDFCDSSTLGMRCVTCILFLFHSSFIHYYFFHANQSFIYLFFKRF